MVQAKEAVRKAQVYVPEIFPQAEGKDLTLEGVELTDDTRFWKITFSYPASNGSLLRARDYKTVKLRSEDGDFFGAYDGFAGMGAM